MLYNDDNGNNSNSIHDKSVRNLAVDNPRGDFCCPQFPGRNEIWDKKIKKYMEQGREATHA